MKKQNKEILLTIGMIVKNEIRCLERCLKALAPLREAIPCQLVIADTGSTDGTREIAEQYADLLFDFEWCDDFSIARNAVMDRAQGKWYLTVDADEYLDPDFSQLVRFLTGPNADRKDTAFVVQRNYSTKEMDRKDDYSDFFALRMVRMATGWRYYGSIHESFPAGSDARSEELGKIILHHDGYVDQDNIGISKRRRNMPLLEKELEKDPTNLQRVVQCLESCYTKEQARKYAVMAVEMVKTGARNNVWRLMGPVALRDAINLADRYGFAETGEWIRLSRETFPASIFTRLDIPFYGALYYIQRQEAKRCLEEIERYWEGISLYREGKYEMKELQLSSLRKNFQTTQQLALSVEIQSLCFLEQWEQAFSRLKGLSFAEMTNNVLVNNFMKLLVDIWKKSDLDMMGHLRQEWEKLNEDREDKTLKILREGFLSCCIKAFRKTEDEEEKRPVSLLFAGLGEDNDIGRAALIIESDNAEEAERLLWMTEDWTIFPAEAMDRALQLGARLPDVFFRQKKETMDVFSALLAKLRKNEKESLSALLEDGENIQKDPGRVQWEFLLAAAAVREADWGKSGSMQLRDRFCARTKEYLAVFCPPAICTEEYQMLLPAPVRFGWWCQKACDALQAGDAVQYIRLLRSALDSNSDMKDMIQFLMDAAEKETSQPAPSEEMMELAKKIKAILAMYSPEDPAVLQLKGSPAYQMVAHLIESL